MHFRERLGNRPVMLDGRTMRFRTFLFAMLAAAAFCTTAAAADRLGTAMTRLAETEMKLWIRHPTIVDAIRAQNVRSRSLTLDEILALDRQWRAETISVSKPMIQALMANALSSFLTQKKQAGDGLYTEIFVMDNKGLNVGQSDVTSDYWQGDEEIWQKTFLAGRDAMHIGPVRRDKSTRVLQSQLSLPVADPVTGKVIGAITFGIDVSRLAR
jgi:hypothetical protein